MEIDDVLKKGREVFVDEDKLNRWLVTYSLALGGLMPNDLLTSMLGRQLVMDELIRIEYGIFL